LNYDRSYNCNTVKVLATGRISTSTRPLYIKLRSSSPSTAIMAQNS